MERFEEFSVVRYNVVIPLDIVIVCTYRRCARGQEGQYRTV